MEGRSLDEQEKEINEVLRKAFKTPAKSSHRKEAMKRLIELARSPHPKLKIVVAQNLKVFIKDFPELEDDAINAVYDLCEDQVMKVRMCGYRAIADVSKEQPKWVKRNADVLVQLLQSDEQDEVSVVKRMLSEHLDMDPAVTLGVLCDQIVPPDEPMDEEEQAIRTRLRSLVLSFMTGEAKRAVERHTSTPGSAAEETLVAGLLRAVDKLTPADIDVIAKDVLLSLPSFKPSSPRGKQLLDAVLEKAKGSLKTDLLAAEAHTPLTNSRYYLDLASIIAVQKRVAHPSHLLRFYFTSQLAAKPTLLRLTEDAQAFVLSNVADTLAACQASPLEGASMMPQEDATLRRQTPHVCHNYLQVFSETKFTSEQRPWKACHVFLKTCLRVSTLPANYRLTSSLTLQHHNEYKWALPSRLGTDLQNIQNLLTTQGKDAKIDDEQDIQSVIRSLQAIGRPPVPISAAPAPTNASQGTSSSPSPGSASPTKAERRIMNVKRKHEDKPASLPPRPTASTTNGVTVTPSTSRTAQQRASTSQPRPLVGLSIAGAAARNGQPSTPQEDELRAAKRAKKGGGIDESPSLLSRLATLPSNGSITGDRGADSGRRRLDSTPVTMAQPRHGRQEPDKNPVLGFSIKGAAKAATTDNGQSSPTPKSSLLARMQGDEQPGGPRRKKRTKTS
ncbi:uncharacterized protein B0H18DRAFT_1036990 [Fomitopsis serialis]|uniref:uncharacterized protein n=1 Tax=Fomitopsis serialis TaxID=139415 RepID=UPI002008D62F|nr:uncharacterized protein B0H18DRAFT_1036990 [Neoantrodia serialis]KAH9916838.1 hypothetical protein B0H18DRAFT_1036990 [Neoantrodia serialis]